MRDHPWFKKVLERAVRTNTKFAGGNTECFRLVDRDVAEVVVERYGPCLWVSWFRGQPPTESDLACIAQLAEKAGCTHWLVNGMVNRGKDPESAQRWKSPLSLGPQDEGHALGVPGRGARTFEPHNGPGSQFPERWQAKEDSIPYNLRADTGLSPGLFLDQRANRRLLRRQSHGAKVLNLFAYTCSFSVAAALGGAASVTSVDVSQRFLDWGKENFASNGLSIQGHLFSKADARDYLNLARKRGWLFDTIVLDPPSFSRSKGKPFTVKKELIPLAKNCVDLLVPGGELLVSTNLSTWAEKDLGRELKDATGCSIRLGECDADITDKTNSAKSFWIKNKTA